MDSNVKNKDKLASKREFNRQLRIRSTLNRKRPTFKRVESWRYKRVPERWRRPRGIDSKVAEKRKGWPKMPSIGYRSPKSVRHLSPTGKEVVDIFKLTTLYLIDPEKQVGRIASTVGRKKRERIISEAEILNIKIVNPMFKKISLEGLEEEIEEEEILSDELIDKMELEDLKIDETGEEE